MVLELFSHIRKHGLFLLKMYIASFFEFCFKFAEGFELWYALIKLWSVGVCTRFQFRLLTVIVVLCDHPLRWLHNRGLFKYWMQWAKRLVCSSCSIFTRKPIVCVGLKVISVFSDALEWWQYYTFIDYGCFNRRLSTGTEVNSAVVIIWQNVFFVGWFWRATLVRYWTSSSISFVWFIYSL